MPADLPDQTDILAANERLTAELASANSSLSTARSEVATLTAARDAAIAERDSATAQVATITAERDAARGTLATVTAERDTLAATDRDFAKRLAGEMAKHGIRQQAVGTGPDRIAEASHRKTITELALEARAAAGDPKAKEALAALSKTSATDGRTITQRALEMRGA